MLPKRVYAWLTNVTVVSVIVITGVSIKGNTSASDEPVSCSTVNNVSARHADDKYWFAMGTGMNSYVTALAIYNGQLIAGGFFTTAGGEAANRVAAWNGSSWSPLGSGMNGNVNALVVFGTRLIAAGSFTTAGGISANRIAAWNGTTWSALGAGMNDDVMALSIYDNKLFAGGEFTTPANRVAIWNGATWLSPGLTGEGTVYAFAIYDNKLIAGGYFWPVSVGIQAWNGSSWSYLGSGVGFTVRALTVYNYELIAAGLKVSLFNTLATWDGISWTSLEPSGMNGDIYTLYNYTDHLVAGGDFTTAGGALGASRIAAWNAASWRELGSGLGGLSMNTEVNTLIAYDNKLVVGGYFTTAGGRGANHIALWHQFVCGDTNDDEIVNILDILYLIDYKFKDGPEPKPMLAADVNGDGLVNILDIIYLIDYKFKGGPEPNCP